MSPPMPPCLLLLLLPLPLLLLLGRRRRRREEVRLEAHDECRLLAGLGFRQPLPEPYHLGLRLSKARFVHLPVLHTPQPHHEQPLHRRRRLRVHCLDSISISPCCCCCCCCSFLLCLFICCWASLSLAPTRCSSSWRTRAR